MRSLTAQQPNPQTGLPDPPVAGTHANPTTPAGFVLDQAATAPAHAAPSKEPIEIS